MSKSKSRSRSSSKSGEEEDDEEDDAGSSAEEGDVESPSGYAPGGFHPVQLGETFDGERFKICAKLGFGHFSTVWRACDTLHGGYVALKVQKSAQHYSDAARDEISLLRRVCNRDGFGKQFVVHLVNAFEHSGPNGTHVCIATEELGDNLLTLIQRYSHRGIPLHAVAKLSYQLLAGLSFLHDSCGIIHTDLKPENILTTSPLPGLQCDARTTAHDPRSRSHLLHSDHATSSAMDVDDGYVIGAKRDATDHCQAYPMQAGERISNSGAKCTRTAAHQTMQQPPKSVDANGNDNGPTHDYQTTDCEQRGQCHQQPTDAGITGADVDRPTRRERLQSANRQREQQQASAKRAYNGPLENAGAERPPPLTGGVDEAGLTPGFYESIGCKIVDLGNACWVEKHFTADIQTRQYRAPEVFLGYEYGTASDVWSAACIIFELATGDLLFTPTDGKSHGKEDDHLALMMELLGRMPKRFALGGKRSREFFDRHNELRRIRRLDYWPLHEVLMEKYNFPQRTAETLKDLLERMMAYIPEHRSSATNALEHPYVLFPLFHLWCFNLMSPVRVPCFLIFTMRYEFIMPFLLFVLLLNMF